VHDRALEHGVHTTLELYPADADVFQLFWSFLPEDAEAVDAAGRFLTEPPAAAQKSTSAG
jgi:hypothetical protein